MSKITCLDRRGVQKIIPFSENTLTRRMKQEEDPFPPGTLIGGKRYWREDDVIEWLARQFGDDAENDGGQKPPREPPATRGDAEVAETRDAAAV